MKYVKTQQEFDKLKQKMLNKLDKFVDDYEEFSKYTSPNAWRLSGHHFFELKNMKKDLTEYDVYFAWVKEDTLRYATDEQVKKEHEKVEMERDASRYNL